jgi:hypothetical protein
MAEMDYYDINRTVLAASTEINVLACVWQRLPSKDVQLAPEMV